MDNQGSSRPSKRIRMEDNPLLKPEIQLQVVSFLNPIDLCAWDLVCREFSNASARQWGLLANSRFGVACNKGKAGWKIGLSLLKKPILIDLIDKQDFGFGDGFAGSPKMATNQSVLVTVSDDAENSDRPQGHTFPVALGANPISIRDAQTLSHYRTLASPIENWHVAVCGRVGCEILVTASTNQLCAARGNLKQTWTQNSVLPPEDQLRWSHTDTRHGIPLLGCETHLITAVCGRVYLYDVDNADGSLVRLKTCLPISDELVGNNNPRLTIHTPENLAWSEDQSHFTFFEPTTKSLYIWRFDSERGSIHPVKSIATDTVEIRNVVLSESYIVGCNRVKKIFVWDRQSGELCHEALCDVPEDEELDEDDIYHPLSMIVVSGDLLVTSSNRGNVLCVWNLKKPEGSLIARHTEAFDLGTSHEELPDGVDVHSMVHLNGLNAFVVVPLSMMAWTFPIDETMRKRVLSIRRRERNIKRVTLDIRQGEMVGDNDYPVEGYM